MSSRHPERERGVIVAKLDNDLLVAEIKKAFPDVTSVAPPELYLLRTKDGIGVLGTEGTGFHSKDGVVGLDVMTPHGYPLDIDLPVEAVEACITSEEVDLADVVRVFGDRLEQNFRLWKRAAA